MKKVVKFSTEGYQVKKFTKYLVKCILHDIHVDVFFTWNTCEAQSAKIILCKISEPILFPFTDRSDYICLHKSIRQQCINKMWTQSLLIAIRSSWRVHVSVSYINLITLYVSINWCRLPSFQLFFFLLTDWTSFEHTREPWIHSRNHVWIIQRPWSVYRCSGRACPGCVVDVTSGWREDPHRNRHRLRRWGHSRHSCCKYSVLGSNVVLYTKYYRNMANQCYIEFDTE